MSTHEHETGPPGSDDEDRRVIQQVLSRGAPDLFREIVSKYQDQIYSLILKMTGVHDTAEDLTQEVFIRAYSALGDFRWDARFSTWLHQIAVNQCRDYFRSGVGREISSGDEAWEKVLSEEGMRSAEWDTRRHELAGQIQMALLELPYKYREAFCLKHVEGLSYREMSQLLGVSVQALKVRVCRARLMLQAILSQEEGG